MISQLDYDIEIEDSVKYRTSCAKVWEFNISASWGIIYIFHAKIRHGERWVMSRFESDGLSYSFAPTPYQGTLSRKYAEDHMTRNSGLEAFIDESIRRSNEHRYDPIIFKNMRERYGTVEAINRLMKSGDIQSGYTRLKNLKLLRYSIEQAVLNFPEKFSREVRDEAKRRLDQV